MPWWEVALRIGGSALVLWGYYRALVHLERRRREL